MLFKQKAEETSVEKIEKITHERATIWASHLKNHPFHVSRVKFLELTPKFFNILSSLQTYTHHLKKLLNMISKKKTEASYFVQENICGIYSKHPLLRLQKNHERRNFQNVSSKEYLLAIKKFQKNSSKLFSQVSITISHNIQKHKKSET